MLSIIDIIEWLRREKRHRRITAQAEFSFVFNLSLVLFIPRPECWMRLFSALRIGTDYETTAGWNWSSVV